MRKSIILFISALTISFVTGYGMAATVNAGHHPRKILPVKISTFTAKYEPVRQIVSLHWVTAFEKNNEHFLIERSLDGVHFVVIGKAKSIGFSHIPQNYYFDDSKPLGGKMFYRLREIDSSGKQFQTPVISAYKPITSLELSSIRSVEKETQLQFAIISPHESIGNIVVADISGHIRKSFQVKLKEGANLESIYIADLKPGIYFLQVNDTDGNGPVMGRFDHRVKER